ncbi:nSTAND1 domain-containing NTPase [Streptomyces griseoviridis]|uniref:nSTAND1 domain-containing NTPase n=1 Tax=Streptomyces griseoviridis TaxID=45398 RepID=UPI0034201129
MIRVAGEEQGRTLSSASRARTVFAERLALLYKEAGNPPLKRVSDAVARLQRVDERGRPVRVSAQRISDWRRARNVPAHFAALAAVLHVLVPQARRARPEPVSTGLYDIAHWQRLWELALADPVGPDVTKGGTEDGTGGGEEGAAGEAPAPGGVCPYRGLAPFRSQDARWFFGRERSTGALLDQLRAADRTGGLVMLVGASGAGKSSLLNAGLVNALRDRGPHGVLRLVPGADPVAELTSLIPGLAEVAAAPDAPDFGPAARQAATAWAEAGESGARTRTGGGAATGGGESPDGTSTTTVDPARPATDPARPAVHPARPATDPATRPAVDPASTPATADGRPTTTAGDTRAPDQPRPPLDPARPPLDHSRPPLDPPPKTATERPTTTAAPALTPTPAPTPTHTPTPTLIVDQFEEAFTLCSDERRRRVFVRLLHAVCAGPRPPVRVVLGVRADFYERCLAHPELADALQHRHMVLGPLTGAELREAVTAPAKAVGLELEPGLAELIVREVGDGARGAHGAGALPLLSHALLATWQRRKGGRLTLAGYRASGGIQGAVAATAERTWSGLDPAARTAVRQLLLRLVRLGEDTQATRRRGTRQQLADESADPDKTRESLEALVRARLVTLDAESVEITHEALLHAWPRLRGWIDEDRGDHLLRQRLEEDARAWKESARDASLLYRGSRLAQAHAWARSAGGTFLTRTAVEFLAAADRVRRRTRLLGRGAVAALVVLAVLAGWAAVDARRQRDDAVFAQVLAEADRFQYSDPSLSAQLTLVAHRLRPDDAGTGNRLVSIVNAALATPLLGHTGPVYLTSFSPDGRTLATASYDRTVRLWDVTDPTAPEPLGAPLTGHTGWVSSAVFSPDGRTLASAGDDGTVRLWDVRDPRRPTPLRAPLTGDDGTVYLVAFSPDGRTLAAADDDGTVRLWDVRDPRHPTDLGTLDGHTAAVRSVAFSPDGRTLASAGDDGTVRLWDVRDPRRLAPLRAPLTGHGDTVHSVAFSPDGRTLASGGKDDAVRLWDVADPRRAHALGSPLVGHTGPVWSVAFSPDGTSLAAGSADSTASVWNVANPAHPSQVGEPLAGASGEMYAVGFGPGGRTLATGSGDGTVRLWTMPGGDMAGQVGAFRPDGDVLATGGGDGAVRLWDLADPARPKPLGTGFTAGHHALRSMTFLPDGRTLAVLIGTENAVQLWNVADPARPVAHGPPVRVATRYAGAAALAVSPDGRTLATDEDDRTVQLLDITDPARPRRLGALLTGHTGYVNALAYSPDGGTLASAGADGTIRLWDVGDRRRARLVGTPVAGHRGPVNTLAFAPDGRTLASGSDDDTVRLWRISGPRPATPVGSVLAGHTEAVVSLTFSRDGRTLASGGNDNTVRLWDVTDPARTSPIGQAMSPNAKTGSFLAFSPDRRVLGVSSGADTVRLWSLDTDRAARRICASTGDVLTRGRWSEYLPRLSYRPPCR